MLRTRVLRCLLLVCGLLLMLASPAFADRPFSSRFSVNDDGAITMAANTVMSCPTGASNCDAARNEPLSNTAQSTALDNGAFNMAYVDIDSDSTTFDSSSADLSVPSGATVLFAGLYWSGESSSAARSAVKFRAPGDAGYSTVTGSVDTSTSLGFYQGFADVTAKVKAAGAGTYTVANVAATQGTNQYGGWALVVAYHDPAAPPRNLTVFDGLTSINGSTGATINVSGFKTPATGPVSTDLGFVAWEGDRNIAGDQASFNGHVLSDAGNPATNFFNGSITNHGADVATRAPDYLNNLGVDADVLALPAGDLANGATTASIGLTTSGDVYAPGVATFATDLYAPKIDQTKTVSDVTHPGGPVQEGDTLRYTISGSNDGQDGATSFVLTDPIPANTTYAASNLSSGTGNVSYDSVNNRVVANLGSGATATAGGRVGPGDSYSVTVDVVVGDTIPDGTEIDDTATANYTAQNLGSPLTTATSAPTLTVAAPDLAISKSHSPTGTIDAGTDVTYSLDVKNVGSADSHGTISVNDSLPAGLTLSSASGSGWDCTGTVTCTRTDAIAAGDDTTITVVAHVSSSYSGDTVHNTATVSAPGDANPANDSATDSGGTAHHADLSLKVGADHPSVNVGDQVTYTLTAHNGGPSDASGVAIADTLPTGMDYVSDDGGCTQSGTAVNCDVGNLASGDSASVHVVAQANSSAAGTTVTNEATVSGAQDDPDTSNNGDSANVDVTSADLAVTATLDPADPVAGQGEDVKIDAVNNGPSPATGVVLTSTLPAGLNDVTATADGGVNCTVSDTTITCPVGPLASGNHVHLDVHGTVGGKATTVSATAAVQGSEFDPDTTNNAAPVSAPVTGSADLSLTEAPDRSTAPQGSVVTYTLTASNAGPSDATGVQIVDHLPSGVTFDSADPGCVNASGTVTCTIGTLAAGDTAVRTVMVDVGPTTLGSVTDNAAVSSDVSDPVPANNMAGATFTAIPAGKMTVVSIKLQPQSTIPVTATCANVDTCVGTATIQLAEDARNGSSSLPAGTVVATGSFSVANGTATFQLTRGSTVPDGLLESSKPLVTVTLTPTNGSPVSATMQLRPGNNPKV